MRKKQKRFLDNAKSRNVIEPGKELFEKIKGDWNSVQFKNENPITLELACGRGEYTVGLARLNKQRNFIGVDIKGARIWKGSTIAQEEGLENVAFLRTQIDHIERFFEKGEVDEIWITFPDPQPRSSDERRRLTHPKFLNRYKNIIRQGGIIHLKTDNLGFFEYTLEVIRERKDASLLVQTKDLYNSEFLKDHFDIKTRYEKKFLLQGYKINYLRFQMQ